MSNRSSVFPLVIAALLAPAGCVGQAAEDTGSDSSDWRISLPTPPEVAWQFDYCLDNAHRSGLNAAMLGLTKVDWYVANSLVGAVVQSGCFNGQESGGIFSANAVGDHNAALQRLSFLPSTRHYAFRVSNVLIGDATSQQWRYLPARFDDSGKPNAQGHYVVASYSIPVSNRPGTNFHVIDQSTGYSLDILGRGPLWSPGQCASIEYLASSRSDDPWMQTLMNATEAFLNSGNTIFNHGGTCAALRTINFDEAPSLAGWPLPFDMLNWDASGNFVASGGIVIP